jgi:hypothetical protein
MDEILQRLSLRFGQTPAPSQAPANPSTRPVASVVTESVRYRAATESIGRLRQEAEHLHNVLTEPGGRHFSQPEHDELLELLGTVLHELWSCEVALQRVAPLD